MTETARSMDDLPELVQALLKRLESSISGGSYATVQEETDTGRTTWRDDTADLMRENALNWWTAGDSGTQNFYQAQNQELGSRAGYSYNSSSGTWTDSSGGAAFTPLSQAEIDAAVIAKMQANSAAWHSASTDAARQALADENLRLGTQRGWWRGSDGYWYDANNQRVYDSDGVLVADAARDGRLPAVDFGSMQPVSAEGLDFSAGMDQMTQLLPGVVFAGTSQRTAPSLAGTMHNATIGTQQNGGVYVNGIEVSSHVTQGTTIGELAQLARGLAIR